MLMQRSDVVSGAIVVYSPEKTDADRHRSGDGLLLDIGAPPGPSCVAPPDPGTSSCSGVVRRFA